MTFNDTAFQYKAHPLQVHVGKRIRVWVLETGHDHFVNHAMTYAEKGQQGTLEITE